MENDTVFIDKKGRTLIIPYDKFDLLIELCMFSVLPNSDERLKSVLLIFNEVAETKVTLATTKESADKAVADREGISIEALVSSPNYTETIIKFLQTELNNLVKEVVEKVNDVCISEITVWAIIAQAKGLLHI